VVFYKKEYIKITFLFVQAVFVFKNFDNKKKISQSKSKITSFSNSNNVLRWLKHHHEKNREKDNYCLLKKLENSNGACKITEEFEAF
jgi:hypothetical protein